MRVTIVADSATPTEVYNLTLAFQRTRGIPLPPQLTVRNGEDPTPAVRVMGTAMTWESPYLDVEQASAILIQHDGHGEHRTVTQNAHEVAVVNHLRGHCHDGAICLICLAQLDRDLVQMRINEIIGG